MFKIRCYVFLGGNLMYVTIPKWISMFVHVCSYSVLIDKLFRTPRRRFAQMLPLFSDHFGVGRVSLPFGTRTQTRMYIAKRHMSHLKFEDFSWKYQLYPYIIVQSHHYIYGSSTALVAFNRLWAQVVTKWSDHHGCHHSACSARSTLETDRVGMVKKTRTKIRSSSTQEPNLGKKGWAQSNPSWIGSDTLRENGQQDLGFHLFWRWLLHRGEGPEKMTGQLLRKLPPNRWLSIASFSKTAKDC